MDVIESTWRVKLIMRSGSVFEGVYIGKMNDSDDDVFKDLLGLNTLGSCFDPNVFYSSICKDEDGLTRIFFRVGDVAAVEISPL